MLTSAILRSLESMPECVDRLLDAWEWYRTRFTSHPPLAEHEEGHYETWQAELSRRLSVSWIIHPAEVADWWRDHGEPLPHNLQAACLQALLEHLNSAYGEEAAECHRVGGVYLALGRRWWNARETCRGNDTPDLLEYNQSPRRLPFTNLRRVYAPRLTVCPDEDIDNTRRALFDKPMRVALCALSGRAHTVYRGTRMLSRRGRLYGFAADAVRCAGSPPGAVCPDYLQELRQVAQDARVLGIDVLCLPELCVCPQGREALADALTSGGSGDTLLIMPGSFHDPLPPGSQTPSVVHYHNSGPVWKVRSGQLQRITHVEKFESFQFRAPPGLPQPPSVAAAVAQAHSESCYLLQEDLFEASHAALIQTPVGWWGVMICRDAIYPQHSALDALCMLADHLVVISMSEKGAEFFRAFSERQAKFHLGAVYYVNAAQVLRGGSEPANEIHAAWLLPSRQTDTGSNYATEYVTGFSGAESARASMRPSKENGFYLLEIGHRGLV